MCMQSYARGLASSGAGLSICLWRWPHRHGLPLLLLRLCWPQASYRGQGAPLCRRANWLRLTFRFCLCVTVWFWTQQLLHVLLLVLLLFLICPHLQSPFPYKLPHSEEVSMCTSSREGALFFIIGPLQRSNDIMRMKYLAQFPAHSNNSINVYPLPSNYW